MRTDVGDDGDEGDDFEDGEPPIDGVGLGGQDAFFEVDDLVFGSVEADDAGEKHHSVGEGEGGSEEGGGCEDVYDVHVPDPGVVEFFGVHVGVHLVLFFVEVVNRLEEAEVEFRGFVRFAGFPPFVYPEHQVGHESPDDGCAEVHEDQR
jgi:hypothetical protein